MSPTLPQTLLVPAEIGRVQRSDRFYVLEPYQHKVFELARDVILPGLGPVARFKTDGRGIRGRPVGRGDRYRILTLGCSVTVSTFVDQVRTWSAQLEQRLNGRLGGGVWVGSAGKDEATSRDVVAFMEHFVPQYAPQIDTIVCMVGVNDMALMLSKGSRYDSNYWHNASVDYQVRKAFCRVPRVYASDGAAYPSPARMLAGRVKRALRPDVFRDAGAFYQEKRASRQAASQWLDRLPDMTPGLSEYAANIRAIMAHARKLGIEIIFLTQPSLWRAGLTAAEERLLWFGWVADTTRYYSAELLAHAMDLYNQCLARVCEEEKTHCVDLAGALARDTSVFYDDVHFNEGGSAAAAGEIAPHLELPRNLRA